MSAFKPALLCVFVIAPGCAAPRPSPQPLTEATARSVSIEPAPVTPTSTSAASTPCTTDQDCVALEQISKTEGKIGLCEVGMCALHDFERALEWALGIVPELRRLDRKIPTIADAPWYTEGEPVELYLPENWIRDEPSRRCQALGFRANKGALTVTVDSRTGRPPARFACFSTLLLDRRPTLHGETCPYPDGSVGGFMSFENLQGGALSAADDAGLVYDRMTVTVTPRCSLLTVERPGCEPATCQTCRLSLVTKRGYGALSGSHGPGFPDASLVVEDPTCPPCLPDPIRPLIPRLARILGRATFAETFGNADAFRAFRKRSDCEEMLKSKRKAR